MPVAATRNARQAGFPQGIALLLPITLAVIGVSVFTATGSQMLAHFKDVPNGNYLIDLLQNMPGIWIAFFSPIAGWLADLFGRKRILLVSMLAYAVAGMAPFWLENLYAILATRCVVGMCESIVLTVTTTMLCDYFKGRSRERWLASQTGLASLSAVAVITAGGVLGAKYGWQGPFLVYGISLLWFVGVAVLCWEPPHEQAGSTELAAPDADALYQTIPWMRTLGILAITVVGAVMFYSTITKHSFAFQALGLDNPADIGAWAARASWGVPVGTLLFWALGRLHIGLLLFIDFLLIGMGFTWMANARSLSDYALAANLQGIGCGLILPTLLVWATRGLAYQIRGRGNGLWQGAFGLGFFVSGMVITLVSGLFVHDTAASSFARQVQGILPTFGALGKISLAAAVAALVGKLIWGRAALPSVADKP